MVRLKNLKHASQKHYDLYMHHSSNNNHNIDDSLRMVLFYAVECGLKYLYINDTEHGKASKKEYEGKMISINHNIRYLLRELNLKDQYSLPRNIKCEDKQSINFNNLHAEWRYGRKFHKTENQRCEKALLKIMEYICERVFDCSKWSKQ